MDSFGAGRSFNWGPKWDLPSENFSAFVSLYRSSLILRLPSRTAGGAETALRDFCFGVHPWVALTFLFTKGAKFPLTVSPVLSQAWCWELFQQTPALLPQESADNEGNQWGLMSESCPAPDLEVKSLVIERVGGPAIRREPTEDEVQDCHSVQHCIYPMNVCKVHF